MLTCLHSSTLLILLPERTYNDCAQFARVYVGSSLAVPVKEADTKEEKDQCVVLMWDAMKKKENFNFQ